MAVKIASAPIQLRTTTTSLAGLSLPTEMHLPTNDLSKQSWLIYGRKKIGKSSLAAQFPGSLNFSFEPGSEEIKLFKVDIPIGTKLEPGWKYFVKYIDLLEKTKHNYKMAVLDTGFEAYNRCLEYVCTTRNIPYPKHDDFGDSWNAVKTEFRMQHTRLKQMGIGLIIICHDKMKQDETPAGQKFDYIIPNLSAQADDLYRGIIANVGYYHYREKQRFLIIRGTDYIMAGVASGDERWRTKSGDPVYSVPMGTNAQQSYANLLRAFNNQQTESFEDETKRFADEEKAFSIRKKAKKPSR